MNLYDTIIKDVIMGQVYDYQNTVVVIDLNGLSPHLELLQEHINYDFNTTLLFNALVQLMQDRQEFDTLFRDFVVGQMKLITLEYADFDPILKIEKIKAFSVVINTLRNIAYNFRDILTRHDLFDNNALLVNFIAIEYLGCAMATLKDGQWALTNKLNTSSTSETPLEYLEKILISI